jgi:hypothetical protein
MHAHFFGALLATSGCSVLLLHPAAYLLRAKYISGHFNIARCGNFQKKFPGNIFAEVGGFFEEKCTAGLFNIAAAACMRHFSKK